ncbi:MAG TPA: transporter substrate-binding domain-containing protein [Solibacillus sp.]
MKKKWLLAVLTTLVIAVLAACGTADEKETTSGSEGPADGGNKKTLVVGTSADYAPFEFVDTATSDEIIGFDIELIKTIGDKLGYEIEVQNMDFNSLITALQAKKFDVVISGMTPTEERDKVVDFSVPYYETEQYLIFDKEKSYTTPADIKGGVVGAQISSIQEEIAIELGEANGFKVESRNLIPELIQELKTGRFDAAVIENIVSENYLSKNDDLAAFPIEVEEPDYKAIVFQEGSELKAEFDKVIEELNADGTIEELKKKWFVVE